MSKNQYQKKNRLKNYARVSSLAIQMGLIIAGGAYLGDYLDSYKANQVPIFTIVFSLLAIAAALYLSFKDITKK